MSELSPADFDEILNVNIGIDDVANIDVHEGEESLESFKASVTRSWIKARYIICAIYKANPNIDVNTLITAVLTALGIAVGPLATAVTTLVILAIKKGLDKVCAI